MRRFSWSPFFNARTYTQLTTPLCRFHAEVAFEDSGVRARIYTIGKSGETTHHRGDFHDVDVAKQWAESRMEEAANMITMWVR